MDGENGRRLDNQGEKPTSPFQIVNSERISISGSKQQENGRSPAKISDSSHNVPNVCVECRNGRSHAPTEALCRLEKSPVTDSPGSFKWRSDVVRDPFVLTESPTIQVMERSKTSDPNTVPTESPSRWSVDSGDSLFSIHMGNDSFSKERSLSISGDIGELSLSEAYLPRVSPKSGDLHRSVDSSYSSPAAAAAAAKAIEEARRVVEEDTKSVADVPKCDPPEASISVHTDSNLSRSNDANLPHDDNKGTNESSAPPSTSESACPMCQCLCCDRMSSCCRWPSCSCGHWFHLPSCSNSCISCPSCCSKFNGPSTCCCYSGNRETKRVRSVSFYALMDSVVASSSKHKV